jgi:hypothetical protein
MSHPNVVMAHDAGVARGFLYLVMEYVEGIDLGHFVAENGPLPVPLACEAVRQAALALQYAHDRGIVHRDIKPDNLLLTWPGPATPTSVGSLPSLPDGTSGEGGILVKLLDLGLALPAELPAEQVERAGTPDFVAPEQAGGNEPVDGRSDLYSLGCTFYYLLTGRVPYPGGTCTEKLLRHGIEVPHPVEELRPDVPRAVAAIVERLMAKKPEERYPGPAAVASILWAMAEQGWSLGSPPLALTNRRTDSETSTDALAEDPGPRADALFPDQQTGSMRAQSPELHLDRTVDETPSVPSLPELPPMPAPVLLPAARRRMPAARAVLVAAMAGPLLAFAARGLPTSPTLDAGETPVRRAFLPFRVERLDREFVTLTEAITAAADGDTLTIHGVGPHVVAPTDLGEKSLTLRAEGSERPRLEPKNPEANGPWQAFFATSRSLTLQGLELATTGDAPLIAGTGARFDFIDCRLVAAGPGPAVVIRGGDLSMKSCRVRARATAIAMEVDGIPCKAALTGNTVAVGDPKGVALAVWAPEACRSADVNILLERNVIESGRVTSFRALPGQLQIEANANDFTFREALASFADYAGAAGWRHSTSWKGRDNRCHASGYWLSVDGRAIALRDAAGWQRLWGDVPASGPLSDASSSPSGLR